MVVTIHFHLWGSNCHSINFKWVGFLFYFDIGSAKFDSRCQLVCYYLNDVFLFFVQSRFYKLAVNETVLWFQVGYNRSHVISLLFHANFFISIRFVASGSVKVSKQ